jgi:vacuolar protein sorting-associated protein 11
MNDKRNADPNVWINALSYFSGKNTPQAQARISEVLQHIDKNNLLPPLLVLQILAQDSQSNNKGERVNLIIKPNVTLGVIKDYIIQRFDRDNQQISDV